MRQLAWLCSCNKGSTKSRWESLSQNDEDSPYLELPDISDCSFYFEMLKDLGFVRSSGMGVVSIPFTEIQAYLEMYELNVSAWGINLIHNLSSFYADQHMLSADKEVTAPNAVEMDENHRTRVDKALKSYFFKNSKPE